MSETDITGQYEILGELGQGGMGKVYLARQVSVNREVALKVLPRELTTASDFLARFMREVEVIAELQHARIIPVYDYGEMDGQPFVALALMPGGSLAGRLADGPIPLKEAVQVIDQIAEALDYVHERGIVHRDLKPGNILLDNSGNAFLADFGIARVVEATAQITGTGILGTPPFMAPELFMTSDATPASDIYALGVTLFQLLTDRYPFEGNTPAQQMMGHLERPVPSAYELSPHLPPEVDTVLATAMAKDPAERYTAAGAMAAALREAARSKSSRSAPAGVAAPAAHPKSRLSILIGSAVVGLLLVIAVAIYLIVNAGRDPQVSEATPTDQAVPHTDTPSPTATSPARPTNVASSALITAPTATPEPKLGGGSGVLGFNADGYAYMIDVDCVFTRRAVCDPLPKLLPPVGDVTVNFGNVSPDGERIAFVTGISTDLVNFEEVQVFVVDVTGQNLTLLAEVATVSLYDLIPIGYDLEDDWGFNSTRLQAPVWTADGSLVAFILAGNVWVSDAQCREQSETYCLGESRIVADETTALRSIHWSADGEWIAYNGGSGLVNIVTGAYSNDAALRDEIRAPHSPLVSPDRQFALEIAFETITFNTQFLPQSARMFRITRLADEVTIELPVPFCADTTKPEWTPDGRYLVYFAAQEYQPYRNSNQPAECLVRDLYLLDVLQLFELPAENLMDAVTQITNMGTVDRLTTIMWFP